MPKTYYISPKDFHRIRRASTRADIHEVCFLLFGRGSRIRRVVSVPNRAEDTVLTHVIESRDVHRVRRHSSVQGLWLLGFLHTHPISEAYPSRGDLAGYAPGAMIFIYSEWTKKLRAFRVARKPRKPIEKKVDIVPEVS